MQHEFAAPHNAAKGGCYLCTNPNDVVVTDAAIEGEGTLVLCTGCILDLAAQARAGRARKARIDKIERQRRDAEAQAERDAARVA